MGFAELQMLKVDLRSLILRRYPHIKKHFPKALKTWKSLQTVHCKMCDKSDNYVALKGFCAVCLIAKQCHMCGTEKSKTVKELAGQVLFPWGTESATRRPIQDIVHAVRKLFGVLICRYGCQPKCMRCNGTKVYRTTRFKDAVPVEHWCLRCNKNAARKQEPVILRFIKIYNIPYWVGQGRTISTLYKPTEIPRVEISSVTIPWNASIKSDFINKSVDFNSMQEATPLWYEKTTTPYFEDNTKLETQLTNIITVQRDPHDW